MMRMRILVMAVAVALAGCAAQPVRVPAAPVRYPELDSALAAPCVMPAGPDAPDYDAWQAWLEGPMLRAFSDCAIRHRAIVAAWPRASN